VSLSRSLSTKFIKAAVIATLAATSVPALAAVRTVTLAVDNMTCVTCVPMVKKSLSQIRGVKRVAVSVEAKTATVVYDDKATNVAELVKATTNAGYPSRLKRSASQQRRAR